MQGHGFTTRSMPPEYVQQKSGMTEIIVDQSAIQATDLKMVSPNSQNSFGISRWKIDSEKQKEVIRKQVQDILNMNIVVDPPVIVEEKKSQS